MWPIWVFDLMLLVAAVLLFGLLWEALKDLNATLARKWRTWRTRRDTRAYLRRHAQFAREAGR